MVRNDERATLTQLKAVRRELVDPLIAKWHGRTVKLMGDGALVEFASAVDALQHAAEMQQAMANRNQQVPHEKRIEFRIGINVGDIIVEGEDILGDGVNVAARLEGLAEPGGICISGNVHEHVRGAAGLVFDDLGEQIIKNIAEPVHAFWVSGPSLPKPAADAGESPSRPDNPSIAVLPFLNMSGDPEQEYFSDGVTEDLITALSRIRTFFVAARNSAFAYKGVSPNIRRAAGELGVRYMLPTRAEFPKLAYRVDERSRERLPICPRYRTSPTSTSAVGCNTDSPTGVSQDRV